MCKISYILLLWLTEVFSFTIVKTNNGTEDTIYLLNNGWAKKVLNSETVSYFNFDVNQLAVLPWHVISVLKPGSPIPLIKKENETPDELMRTELLKISVLQASLMYDIEYVGEYINPSVVQFQGRYILCSGLGWGFSGINKLSANERLNFAWINTTDLPFHSTEPNLGISMELNDLSTEPSQLITGQDPRMIVLSDNKLFISFTNRFTSRIRMGFAILTAPSKASSEASTPTVEEDTGTVLAVDAGAAGASSASANVKVPTNTPGHHHNHSAHIHNEHSHQNNQHTHNHHHDNDLPPHILEKSTTFDGKRRLSSHSIFTDSGKPEASAASAPTKTNLRTHTPKATRQTSQQTTQQTTQRLAQQTTQQSPQDIASPSPNITLRTLHNSIEPPDDQNSHHKNWSPFLFNNTLCFIQRLNPLHIVSIKDMNAPEINLVTLSKRERSQQVVWKFGELRGGTNAIFVRNTNELDVKNKYMYLSFFHSSSHIPGNPMTTYWFGAFTFSAHPPFRLLGMSEYPIVLDRFYTGDWNPLKNRKIDYVVFPSTIQLIGSKDSNVISLSFGHQDHAGYLAKMKVSEVLDVLVPLGDQ